MRKSNKKRHSSKTKMSYILSGVPKGIRTPDTRLRRPLLYPAELLGHNQRYNIIQYFVLKVKQIEQKNK